MLPLPLLNPPQVPPRRPVPAPHGATFGVG